MIQINNVSKWHGPLQVLTDCTTRISKGEVVMVCGPCGSGKSALIKAVSGLEPIQRGEIIVDGVRVNGPRNRLSSLRGRLGMVFQSPELFRHLSVRQNLTLGPINVAGCSKEQADRNGLMCLERVGLLPLQDKYPQQLSLEQQQRVAIARALAMNPVAMLFDNPTKALDPALTHAVLGVMTELAQDGMTMMMVTHEMAFAKKYADRILLMNKGSLIAARSNEQFFQSTHSDWPSAFHDEQR